MAASLCNAPPLCGLQDRSSPSCFIAHARFSAQKQLLGTSLPAPHNAPPLPCRQQHPRLTVEAAKRIDSGRCLLLNSTLKSQDENVEKVAALCEGIRQWATEKQNDKQSGLKQFECYTDTFDKNVFHFMARYDSFLHMNNFQALPEYMKFWNDVRPFLSEPIALAAYEYKNGQIGHILNPIGPKGEGGLDDATGQAGRGGEHYMKRKRKPRGLEEKTEAVLQADVANQKVKVEPEDDKWSFDKILARVTGTGTGTDTGTSTENAEWWNLKSLFGMKK